MAKTPMLLKVGERAIRDLAEQGRVRNYRRGTYLFHQGDDPDEIHFLVTGRLEISTLSVTGHRQLHTMIEDPQFFGEFGVLGDMPRTATVVALEDSTVWRARADVYVSFLHEQPTAARAMLRALARQVAAQEAFVEDLLFLDLKGRVAKRLIGLVSPNFDDLPANGAVVPSVVTHSDLASLAGGSRENVTRILSEFQRRGYVKRDGRRYVLMKVDALRRLAGI